MATQGRRQPLLWDIAHIAVRHNLARHPHSGKAKHLPAGKAMLRPQHSTMQELLNPLAGGTPASRVAAPGTTCTNNEFAPPFWHLVGSLPCIHNQLSLVLAEVVANISCRGTQALDCKAVVSCMCRLAGILVSHVSIKLLCQQARSSSQLHAQISTVTIAILSFARRLVCHTQLI